MPGNRLSTSASSVPVVPLVDPESVERSHRRCRGDYGLFPDLMRPIMRIQKSEIQLRSEAFRDGLNSGMSHVAWLARIVAKGGALLVVSDSSHVALSLEETEPFPMQFDRYGIAPGSCWDERVAGTNGIQMALDLGRSVTVRGKDHFYTSLHGFSCTAAPIVDEFGEIRGALNVAAMDNGRSDHLAHYDHLVSAAADLLQEDMFRRRHSDRVILSLHPTSSPAVRNVPNALIALDDDCTMVGATDAAARLLGMGSSTHLVSMPITTVLDVDMEAPFRDGRSETVVRGSTGAGIVIKVSHPASIADRRRRRGPTGAIGSTGALPARSAAREAPVPAKQSRTPGYFADTVDEISGLLARGVPVVLDGESGTGKTTIIGKLQDNVRQRGGDLLALDCAGVTESEDFKSRIREYLGDLLHSRSATGACRTIALDNLDLSPPNIQRSATSLLRELENGGIFKTLHRDAMPRLRLVSCFSGLSDRLVASGSLRSELLFLVQGERITLPPLRADRDLSATLLDIATDIAGEPVRIGATAMAVLNAHGFPGNLREARGILHHALSMSVGAQVTLADLPRYLLQGSTSPRDPAGPPATDARVISEALVTADWNVSLAARRLGISRATINRRMRALDISRPLRGGEPCLDV